MSNLPVLERALVAYKLWHVAYKQFPRLEKFSLGTKLDTVFTDVIEILLMAGYAPREQKAAIITQASTKLDVLKFFLQVAWELRCIDHKKYAALVVPLGEVGKMLGGWQKQTATHSPR